ncbi:MAG: GAF domain-containing sensor histidine kinase [Hyphomicrobiales bacterium]
MNTRHIPIPANEAERLRALRSYDVLDSAPEERFDRVTRMACRLLDVPICLVSLVDSERQWFKSRQGLDATETPRDISFCTYTIMQDEMMVVPNALEDPRFRDNPLVLQDPKIRFYAGAPLTNQAGQNVGTLCAIDRRPRNFTDDQKTLFRDLAAIVVDELELRVAGRRAAQELKSKEAVLEDFNAVFSGIDYGVMFMGPDLRARLINDAFCRMWNVSDEFAQAMPTFDQMIEYLRDGGIYDVPDAEWADYVRDRREALLRADGKAALSARSDGRVLEYKCIPLPDGGRMLTYADVTERERNMELKSEFVSIVSHELRTPLSSLVAALGLISRGTLGDVPQQARSLIAIAHNNAQRLVALVNDILDVQKIEAGRLDYHFEPVDIVALTRQALSETEIYGAEYGVRFRFEENIGQAWVNADALRLTQVLTNLLSNAAKYSSRDEEVIVRAFRTDRSIRLSVCDGGQGIAQHMHGKIFQKFTQVDASDVRAKKGTGLGLSICKAIVEAHGGDIRVESLPGAGATFYFDLIELTGFGRDEGHPRRPIEAVS